MRPTRSFAIALLLAPPALATECTLGRVDPARGAVAIVSAANVENAHLPVERLRAALARRSVAAAGIDLLLVDESRPERLPALLAAEPLASRAALVTFSGHIARALVATHLAVPTVFATIVDPEEWGIGDLAAPRKTNATGLTYAVGQEAKYLEHLKTAFPHVRRVGILADRYFFERATASRALKEGAARLGLVVVPFVAETAPELELAFADPRASRVDAWMVPETPVVFRHEERVLELVRARKVPNIFGHPPLLEKGALMTFGVDLDMYGELATLLKLICGGMAARDIPIVRPRHSFLGVNLTQARARGLAVNPRILPLATTIH